MPKYLASIDLSKNELQNARIQNLASAPGSPAEGLCYFDTTLHQFGVYSNSVWVYLAASAAAAAGALTGTTLASGVVNSSLITFGVNPAANNFLDGFTTTVTAAGTLTLVVGNNKLQFFTGTSTHTLVLPVVSTLVQGHTFIVVNNSTGNVTVQSSGANSIQVMAPNSMLIVSSILTTGTTAASWNAQYLPALIAATNVANSWTGVQTFGAAGNVGKLAIAGTTSGSTILNASATASGTLTLPAATDTLIGKATADVLTNKSYDAAGTGNVLSNIATSMFASNVVDTDGTLTANSDTRLASQKATKTYVDSAIQGIQWKNPVRAATTTPGTLATAYANGQVIDGVTLATGDRILLKDQSAGAENGIYVVAASGAPTRAVDMDVAAEVPNFVVDVREGTANADTAWVCTNNGAIVIGTTALVIVDFVKANVPTATTAIQGKVFLATQAEAEAKSDTSKAVVSADLVNFPIKKLFTIGDGSSTSLTCTHSLGTKDVMVQVRDAATDAVVYCDIVNTSTTVTTLTFAVAPASNAYKVVIIG